MPSPPSIQSSPTLFAGAFLGLRPHKTQAQLLECRSRIVVACCGRQWGKSTADSILALHAAMTVKTTTGRGASIGIFAPTFRQAMIIWERCHDLATSAPQLLPHLDAAKTKRSGPPTITLRPFDTSAPTSTIWAATIGRDGKTVRGPNANFAIIDEAALVPLGKIESAIMPMLLVGGYDAPNRVLMTGTPAGTTGEFYDYWRRGDEGTDPMVEAFRFPSASSPLVDQSWLEARRKSATRLQFDVEYEAAFCDDLLALFPRSLIESCIDPGLAVPEAPSAGRRYVIGMDPAKFRDRSATVVLDVTETPHRVVHLEDLRGHDLLPQAAMVKGISDRYGGAAILVDSNGSGQAVWEELGRLGAPVSEYRITSNQAKLDLCNGLVRSMEARELRIPDHEALIRELTYFRRIENPQTRMTRMEAAPGEYDDYTIALALAVQKTARPPIFSPQSLARMHANRVPAEPWMKELVAMLHMSNEEFEAWRRRNL